MVASIGVLFWYIFDLSPNVPLQPDFNVYDAVSSFGTYLTSLPTFPSSRILMSTTQPDFDVYDAGGYGE
eukprot:gene6162-2775_t